MFLIRTFFMRYRMRVSRLGALGFAGLVFEILRRQPPDTLATSMEAGAWAIVAYVVGRRVITFVIDSVVNSVREASRRLFAAGRGAPRRD